MSNEDNPDTEGTVDWKSAEAFTRGTPQDETPEDGEPAEFTPKQFKYSGRTITANSADEAAAIDALIRESRGANGRLGQENADLKERLARVEGRLEAAPVRDESTDLAPPPIQLARDDPEAWYAAHLRSEAARLEKTKLEIENGVREQLTARDSADRQERASKSWGDAFYATNKHLDTPARRTLVQDAYRRHADEITAYGNDVSGAHQYLADIAEAAIAEVGVLSSKSTTRPPHLESSTRRVTRPQTETQREVVTGSTWIAKERARMRGESPNK